MLCFDIGANRGDFTIAALNEGYEVIAIEPAPRVYAELVKRFIYEHRVTPLRNAIAEINESRVDFYECVEDGLSTLNIEWLTNPSLPYCGKPYQIVDVTTITLDTLANLYGAPDLIKIDVEGGEWGVLRGMTKKYGMITMEWTFETLDEHEKQLDYLYALGYKEVAPQYIMPHLYKPRVWFELKPNNHHQLLAWHQETSDEWIEGGWKLGNLRPTADVGMVWIR